MKLEHSYNKIQFKIFELETLSIGDLISLTLLNRCIHHKDKPKPEHKAKIKPFTGQRIDPPWGRKKYGTNG